MVNNLFKTMSGKILWYMKLNLPEFYTTRTAAPLPLLK